MFWACWELKQLCVAEEEEESPGFVSSIGGGDGPIPTSVSHTVDPSGSLTSQGQEEDEDHNQDGHQHPDGTPLSATWQARTGV